MNTIVPFQNFIGKKVTKFSKASSKVKPFKSGLKVNTVRGVVPHPEQTALRGETVWAFVFVEDDSYVACHICRLAE